jgi:acetyl-CoA acetyltransferase
VKANDIEQQIALLTAETQAARLQLELRRSRIYRDLYALESQQAAYNAARARHFDPIVSASGRVVGWFKKEY